jgi:hypothetical protein
MEHHHKTRQSTREAADKTTTQGSGVEKDEEKSFQTQTNIVASATEEENLPLFPRQLMSSSNAAEENNVEEDMKYQTALTVHLFSLVSYNHKAQKYQNAREVQAEFDILVQ